MKAAAMVEIAGQEWVLVKTVPRQQFGAATARTMEHAGIVARLTVRRHGGRTLYYVNDYGAGGLGAARRTI